MLRLLKLGGWEASGADTSEIRARIEDLYAFEPERRTLSVLASSLPSATWPAWSRWIEGGAWGGYFDNPAVGAPDLEFADWQVIDLAGAVEHPDLCDAALSYLLERMRLGGRGSVRGDAAEADGRGRSLALPAGPGGA